VGGRRRSCRGERKAGRRRERAAVAVLGFVVRLRRRLLVEEEGFCGVFKG
jgi:hypothetical protein